MSRIKHPFPEALVNECSVIYTSKETRANKFTISPSQKEIRVKLSLHNTAEQNELYKNAVAAFVSSNSDRNIISSHRGRIFIKDNAVKIHVQPQYFASCISFTYHE